MIELFFFLKTSAFSFEFNYLINLITLKELIIIIIIINSYTLVTSIRSIHEKLYAMCVE